MTAPAVITPPDGVIDDINIYSKEDHNNWFEKQYTDISEPWGYSKRGAELNRIRFTVEELKKYKSNPDILLEVASAKGLMTEKFLSFCNYVVASDISLTAVKACKERCVANNPNALSKMSFFVTGIPGLPFANEAFDVVTLCDGLVGWWFPDEKKKLALDDAYRVLKKGGIVVLTDFFTNENLLQKFDQYENIIRSSKFTVVSTKHLYDRPWYLMESIFKKLHLQNILRPVLSSVRIAKILNGIGKLGGRKLSNHFIIIARKD